MPCRRRQAGHVTEIDGPHPGTIMRRPRETRFPTGSVGADREQKKGAPVGITTETGEKGSLEIDISRPIAGDTEKKRRKEIYKKLPPHRAHEIFLLESSLCSLCAPWLNFCGDGGVGA